jgi:hypothetical protein
MHQTAPWFNDRRPTLLARYVCSYAQDSESTSAEANYPPVQAFEASGRSGFRPFNTFTLSCNHGTDADVV